MDTVKFLRIVTNPFISCIFAIECPCVQHLCHLSNDVGKVCWKFLCQPSWHMGGKCYAKGFLVHVFIHCWLLPWIWAIIVVETSWRVARPHHHLQMKCCELTIWELNILFVFCGCFGAAPKLKGSTRITCSEIPVGAPMVAVSYQKHCSQACVSHRAYN